MKLFRYIFSVSNEKRHIQRYYTYIKYKKIITILGFKIAVPCRYKKEAYDLLKKINQSY